jgi:glycosyltransferase involved in cell wall biosynthesis
LLKRVSGARVLENETNLGYLRSVNRGAQLARGRWLVLANNDIEVLPNWADELLDCGESADDIAIVAPMYLQPDGLISEAGGIIWNDASGHNYGRGDWPEGWRYGWRREVDYGSAAALLVRTDVWREIGGFDERFLPMYYEDVDLCFAVRALGYRVMYEPQARVLHKEGSSAGTDENEGHKRHQALNRPRFRAKWENVLDRHHLTPPEHPWDAWAGATARRGDRVVLIDHRMPFWDKEAGALRTLEILKSLIASGHHVTFLPDNGANTEPYCTELQRMGVEVMFGPDLLTQLAMVIAPHIHAAIVSRPSVAARYMTLMRRHAPDAVLIYDTVDLHWVREAREAALAVGHHEAELLTQEALWTQSLELALIRAADVTLVATDLERARVESELPDAKVRVLPTINPVRESAPGLAERSGIIFVGGFEHTPNIDAVLRLVTGVMPVIWEMLPDVTLRIVGAAAPPQIEALASDRVEILGWVRDLDPLLDAARVTVAPLSYGAGMKGKITQALAFGLPVVTTPVGAEGLTGEPGEALLVGDSDAALARHAIAVLTDDALWWHLAQAGRDLAAAKCSPAIVAILLGELLKAGMT